MAHTWNLCLYCTSWIYIFKYKASFTYIWLILLTWTIRQYTSTLVSGPAFYMFFCMCPSVKEVWTPLTCDFVSLYVNIITFSLSELCWSHQPVADRRTETWFLMSSPLPQTLIIAAYIYFVTSLGPRLMENRKAFDLKGVLIVYNFSVVALSLYMCYEASRVIIWLAWHLCLWNSSFWMEDFTQLCLPQDHSSLYLCCCSLC